MSRNEFIRFFNERTEKEQNRIDIQWTHFYESIALSTNLYLAKYRSIGHLIFKEPRSPQLLINRLNFKEELLFIQLVLPEYKAIYVQNYDDTHILYFECRKTVEPLLDIIMATGLYVLSFRE